MNRQLRIGLALLVTVATAVGFFVKYVTHVHREQLKEWRYVQAEFTQVAGLEVGDAVMISGARLGRVGAIDLWEDRHRVTLWLEPEVVIYEEGSVDPVSGIRRTERVEVVATSALGFVAIDMDAGDATSRPLAPGVLLKGFVRSGLGGKGVPGEDVQRDLQQTIQDLAWETTAMKQPDSGLVGALLFDPDGAIRLDDTLGRLEETAQRIDARLALAERGEAGRGLFKEGAAEAFSEIATAAHQALTSVRDSLREANRAEEGAGRLLADPTAAVDLRTQTANLAEGLHATATGEGTLGRLVTREEKQITGWVERAERITTAAIRGEGLLGSLCADAKGEALRQGLEGLAEGTRSVRDSALVSDPNGALGVQDGFGGLDDTLNDLRRSVDGIRGGLPDKTFTGVLFGVF